MVKLLPKLLNQHLGVFIDNKLNWRDHVPFVCRKVARGLGIIIKARKVLQKESLISLYYSFIYPYLIYCNQIWGSACKTQIEPLFILQKKALRIITSVHLRSPSEPLFRQLKFLNCENIFKYLVGCLMFRVHHGELSTFQFLFVKNSDIHMHNTRQSGHYHIPMCRTNLGKSSLRYFGAWLWNKILSTDINSNVSDFINWIVYVCGDIIFWCTCVLWKCILGDNEFIWIWIWNLKFEFEFEFEFPRLAYNLLSFEP